MLQVRLIGTFDIRFNGNSVSIASRSAQSIFAYLILTAGIQHRREKVAGMFWPDASEKKARAYLRHELWVIRKALSSVSQVEYLIADDINISFNVSAEYWLDVAVIRNLSGSASVRELMNALTMFGGELLPGIYDDWITQEREHLQTVFEQKMAHLMELLEKEKCWKDILEWAERWISLGHGPEAAYRYLMTAYDSLGDRSKVASTYKRCVQALRELDLDPSEQTRSLAFKRTFNLNIPIPLTSFIGREKELKEVAGLFSKSRLITLTGSGGVGKTRLSIQVVADVLDKFPDGIWFLDLAPLSDPSLVPSTLANLLGLRESGDTNLSVTKLIINYFRSRTALVIFDNCEHLIESCAQLVHSLLTSCEDLSVLATSREALRVSGEIPYRVPSLELSGADIESAIDTLPAIESVRLFIDRARVSSPGFAITSQNALVVYQICQRLDGIPLAIELAATRVNVLTVEQILKRLDDRFNLLSNGLRSVLLRHQTLRSTIDWSYDLLPDKERMLFKRLAIFAGGWTLEAAEAVCNRDGIEAAQVLGILSQLVNKSLVLIETIEGEARFRFLETIRQYAHQKLLEAGDVEAIRDKHLAYFVKLAEQAKPQLRSVQQLAWLDRLDAECDNIRTALNWAQERGAIAEGLRLATDLELFWGWRAYQHELSIALENLLARPLPADQIQVFARGHRVLGNMQWELGDKISALTHVQESERLCLLLGPESMVDLADARSQLIYFAQEANANEPILALQKYNEHLKLVQETGDQRRIANTIFYIGINLERSGDFIGARQALEQSLRLMRKCGDMIGTTGPHRSLALLALEEGNYAEARTQLEENLHFLRQARLNINIDIPLWGLAVTAIREGDYVRAKEWYTECLLFDQQIGLPRQLAECLIGFAGIASAEKRFERAAQLLGASEAKVEAREIPLENVDQIELKRLTAVLREELVDGRFEAFVAQGRAMTMEQVIALALESG